MPGPVRSRRATAARSSICGSHHTTRRRTELPYQPNEHRRVTPRIRADAVRNASNRLLKWVGMREYARLSPARRGTSGVSGCARARSARVLFGFVAFAGCLRSGRLVGGRPQIASRRTDDAAVVGVLRLVFVGDVELEVPCAFGDGFESGGIVTHIVFDRIIDLEPLLNAAVLLETPLMPLCRPECLGLCPTCGANLNDGPCGCAPGSAEPFRENPFAVLKNLDLGVE